MIGLGDLAVHRATGEGGCGTGRQVRVKKDALVQCFGVREAKRGGLTVARCDGRRIQGERKHAGCGTTYD